VAVNGCSLLWCVTPASAYRDWGKWGKFSIKIVDSGLRFEHRTLWIESWNSNCWTVMSATSFLLPKRCLFINLYTPSYNCCFLLIYVAYKILKDSIITHSIVQIWVFANYCLLWGSLAIRCKRFIRIYHLQLLPWTTDLSKTLVPNYTVSHPRRQ
jgi:hypothetical protein